MKITSILMILLSLFVMLAVPAAARADTRYVSDELIITLRSGRSAEFRILDYLKTGTPLEVLEEEGAHLRVRTRGGKEGWVLKRYTTSEQPKAEVIRNLRKQIEDMKTTVEEAEIYVAERERLLEENKRLKTEKENIEQKLRRLERKELLYWFLAGAGVLLLGWLIGKASRQKRYY